MANLKIYKLKIESEVAASNIWEKVLGIVKLITPSNVFINGSLNITNNTYTVSDATTTVRVSIEVVFAAVSNASNTITATTSSTYVMQVNSSEIGVINVP